MIARFSRDRGLEHNGESTSGKLILETTTLPLSYVIYKEHRMILSTGSGQLTSADISACIDQARSDPEFDPNFDQLVDFREVSFVDVSSGETRALANKPLFSAESKRAIVAPTAAHFGFARMFAAYNEMSQSPSHMRVFYDLGPALKWLGIENNSDILQALASRSTHAS